MPASSDVITCHTNADLLRGIFAGLGSQYRPFVLAIAGAPKNCKSWGGMPWKDGETSTDNLSRNWYFTLAVYQSGESGYRRQAKNCAAMFGVMLDDIGTKDLPLARLAACPPSLVVETSPGNYQATYLFDMPQTNLRRVAALNQAMVEAKLCDPGAKSPETRWGRLPFAINGKSDPLFKCGLIEWNLHRRYSIEEIINRLELAPPVEAVRKTRSPKVQKDQADESVYVPRADENPVVATLKQRGLYKQPLGSGKHDVTCPFIHEHTDAIDGGTAYFEPSENYPIGGFKCQHSHGDKLRVSSLLDFLSVTNAEAKHKPQIKVEAGELSRVVSAAEAVLAQTKRYYQRGGSIVAVHTDPENNETSIKLVGQHGLVRALSGAATWTRFDKRADKDVVTDPPARHVQVLFDSENYDQLPALSGIAHQPHLRPDGTLVRTAGFDPLTGLFGVFDAHLFEVPDVPTRQQAMYALGELRGLLNGFEFANACDEAAAVAGMLTSAIRQSLPSAPMFHCKAAQIASGKSYLCSLIAAFSTPTRPSAIAFPSCEEECQKLLLASLLAAPGVVMFDNLTSDIHPFNSLCSALTECHLTGRILGVSKTASVSTRALFLSSGNNVDPVKDMARRCITVVLDPKVETPAARHFNAEPLKVVRTQRERFVALALTIVRGWMAMGSPLTDCAPIASYSHWSQWVRQPLLWLGMPDPAQRMFSQLAHDPDRELLGRLLHAWQALFGSKPTMIREVVSTAEACFTGVDKDLKEVLLEVADERGDINRRRLGKWIARHQNRIVDGQRFERASGTTSAERWAVRTVIPLAADSQRS